ncbi:hypothetical protein M231_06918 [Tremella mesenterica]|uniref:Transmembrane protein n=1 Tax=Tremella mesenterica TaxID=5217 RepID=A0A4Q1BD97_TREME|nr:hypothetical protein M231_06918 [Tremella mesenterica]
MILPTPKYVVRADGSSAGVAPTSTVAGGSSTDGGALSFTTSVESDYHKLSPAGRNLAIGLGVLDIVLLVTCIWLWLGKRKLQREVDQLKIVIASKSGSS